MTDYELGLRDDAVVLQVFCDSFAVICLSGILIRIRKYPANIFQEISANS